MKTEPRLLAMTAVAKGRVSSALAGAKKVGSALFRFEYLRTKLRPFVGTIAKRLIGRFAASTIGVGFPSSSSTFTGPSPALFALLIVKSLRMLVRSEKHAAFLLPKKR